MYWRGWWWSICGKQKRAFSSATWAEKARRRSGVATVELRAGFLYFQLRLGGHDAGLRNGGQRLVEFGSEIAKSVGAHSFLPSLEQFTLLFAAVRGRHLGESA